VFTNNTVKNRYFACTSNKKKFTEQLVVQLHLLQQALLHSSLGGVNNVRLSWLGNDILGLLAAYDGFHGMPYASRKGTHSLGTLSNARGHAWSLIVDFSIVLYLDNFNRKSIGTHIYGVFCVTYDTTI